MARPICAALPAEPVSVTSPDLLCASILAAETSASACSLPLIMVPMTESSAAPVGAPTMLSLVRTIVTDRSRSAWSSAGESRHSVMRVVISAVPLAPVVAAAISEVLRLVVSTTAAALVPTAPGRVASADAAGVEMLRLESFEATALVDASTAMVELGFEGLVASVEAVELVLLGVVFCSVVKLGLGVDAATVVLVVAFWSLAELGLGVADATVALVAVVWSLVALAMGAADEELLVVPGVARA